MFVANHYVKAAGKVYTAGEILPELPAEKVSWLLKAGAIYEIPPASEPAEPGTFAAPEESDPATEPENAHAEPEEGTIDEDTEPEEIDVMAGIVKETKPTASKSSSRKSNRRSSK